MVHRSLNKVTLKVVWDNVEHKSIRRCDELRIQCHVINCCKELIEFSLFFLMKKQKLRHAKNCTYSKLTLQDICSHAKNVLRTI